MSQVTSCLLLIVVIVFVVVVYCWETSHSKQVSELLIINCSYGNKRWEKVIERNWLQLSSPRTLNSEKIILTFLTSFIMSS